MTTYVFKVVFELHGKLKASPGVNYIQHCAPHHLIHRRPSVMMTWPDQLKWRGREKHSDNIIVRWKAHFNYLKYLHGVGDY